MEDYEEQMKRQLRRVFGRDFVDLIKRGNEYYVKFEEKENSRLILLTHADRIRSTIEFYKREMESQWRRDIKSIFCDICEWWQVKFLKR